MKREGNKVKQKSNKMRTKNCSNTNLHNMCWKSWHDDNDMIEHGHAFVFKKWKKSKNEHKLVFLNNFLNMMDNGENNQSVFAIVSGLQNETERLRNETYRAGIDRSSLSSVILRACELRCALTIKPWEQYFFDLDKILLQLSFPPHNVSTPPNYETDLKDDNLYCCYYSTSFGVVFCSPALLACLSHREDRPQIRMLDLLLLYYTTTLRWILTPPSLLYILSKMLWTYWKLTTKI